MKVHMLTVFKIHKFSGKKEGNDLFSTWIGQEVMGLNCT